MRSVSWELGGSLGPCEGSVVGGARPTELSTPGSAAVVVVSVGVGSTGAFTLSLEGGANAGRSTTDSSTADNF